MSIIVFVVSCLKGGGISGVLLPVATQREYAHKSLPFVWIVMRTTLFVTMLSLLMIATKSHVVNLLYPVTIMIMLCSVRAVNVRTKHVYQVPIIIANSIFSGTTCQMEAEKIGLSHYCPK